MMTIKELDTYEKLNPEFEQFIITERQKYLVVNLEELVVGVNQNVNTPYDGDLTTLNEIVEGAINDMPLDYIYEKNNTVKILHNSSEFRELRQYYYELNNITQKLVEAIQLYGYHDVVEAIQAIEEDGELEVR